jgi:hypothetical protein
MDTIRSFSIFTCKLQASGQSKGQTERTILLLVVCILVFTLHTGVVVNVGCNSLHNKNSIQQMFPANYFRTRGNSILLTNL